MNTTKQIHRFRLILPVHHKVPKEARDTAATVLARELARRGIACTVIFGPDLRPELVAYDDTGRQLFSTLLSPWANIKFGSRRWLMAKKIANYLAIMHQIRGPEAALQADVEYCAQYVYQLIKDTEKAWREWSSGNVD